MNSVNACIPARLSCDVPTKWHVKESLTLFAPDGSLNVIMSSEPLDGGIDSEQYAAVQGRLLRSEFPGYRELEFQPVTWPHECSAWLRRFQWDPQDSDSVEQLQVYWVDRARGYTGTATAPIALAGQAAGALRSVLRTFRATHRTVEAASPRGGPNPLGSTAPGATLGLLDWTFQVIDAGAVLATFSLDPSQTGRSTLAVIVQIRDPATYSITAQVTERHPPVERWWDVVAAANDWNGTWSWPTASVRRRTDAPDEAEVVLRHDLYLPGGATIDQLADLTDNVIGYACEFWTWAHLERGL